LTTSEFLAERLTGIGGSDIASVLNVGYGCRRRLWYQKRSTPPDFPRDYNKAMRLGEVLEPFFREEYEEASGRATKSLFSAVRHDGHIEILAHVDALIYDKKPPMSGYPPVTGVLEIKSVGREVFYRIKREGLPEDYILQLQHGLLASGYSWGSFAIGSRDSGELLWWDVERDESICTNILSEALAFWALVQNGPIPDALDPDDRRCQRCEYRNSCQGNALVQLEAKADMEYDESLRPLIDECCERQQLVNQATDLLAEAREELKTRLGDRQAVIAGMHKVYYRPQVAKGFWDGKRLAEAYGKAAEQLSAVGVSVAPLTTFSYDKRSRPMRIY
jgi:predicted phage-related endonuclease